MQRRGRSGQPVKGRRTTRPKARKAPIGHASLASLRDKLDQVTRELGEACKRETATSEVLKVISSSPGELEPVFNAMLANATRICEAKIGVLYLRDGDGLRAVVATRDAPPAYVEARKQSGVAPDGPVRRAAATKQVVHTTDIRELQSYRDRHPSSVASVELGKFRTVLGVPMLKDDELIGVITLNRQEVRPFSDKQIELVKNFAAQAVIAIENARLLNELRQRTTDLSEALEQQTATSEVLKVISSSPGELEPVFQAMLANATRICEAKFGTLFRFDGKAFHWAAGIGVPSALAEFQKKRGPYLPESGTLLDRVLQTRKVAHSPDYAAEPIPGNAAKLGGARSTVAVPMLKDSELVGAIIIYRQEVKPFTDKQIELVKNFAAQAVIAIENTRLLNELHQRTGDLSEALDQQTATSQVLKVISSSPGELTPVFESMLENAVRICEASFGNLLLYENAAFRHVALYNAPQAWAAEQQRDPIAPRRTAYFLYRVADTKQVTHIADVALENPDEPIAKVAGARTLLIVPMLKENDLIGVIAIYRQEVRPFTDKQIELVKNFAAQAVIAIENARLLDELRQSLDQQTATADVLKLISRSTFDLPTVLQALVESAARLCDADKAIITREKNGTLYRAEAYGFSREFMEHVRDTPIKAERGSGIGRALLEGRVIHIPDVKADPDFTFVEHQKLGDFRTLLALPMLREGVPKGIVTLTRSEVRSFTDKQIKLATTFADQAAIAIENARLLNDLNKLNQQLEQRVTDQVSEIERMSRLRRFLPPQVADLIVASGAEKQLESHRREITALFCDLRGFTGFSESSDPEDVMSLLRQYHAAIGEIIIKYSGTLEHYAGDGVMVFFNDPIPVPNPALQAVQTALDMRTAIGALIEKWRRLGHELGFGVGIAHGFATLGTIGFEGRFDYAAIGTVSNVASRLCDEAKPGQILISPRVLMAVEDAVTVESVGDFTLKGISRPVAAYNVLSAVSSKI